MKKKDANINEVLNVPYFVKKSILYYLLLPCTSAWLCFETFKRKGSQSLLLLLCMYGSSSLTLLFTFHYSDSIFPFFISYVPRIRKGWHLQFPFIYSLSWHYIRVIIQHLMHLLNDLNLMIYKVVKKKLHHLLKWIYICWCVPSRS